MAPRKPVGSAEADPTRWMLDEPAPEPAEWAEPDLAPVAVVEPAPVAPPLRGADTAGNVRPADDRFLDDDQLIERDLFLEEIGLPTDPAPVAEPDQLTTRTVPQA